MGIDQAEIDFVPRYNLAPTQTASIVAREEGGRLELKRARWGLVPFWAKDEKIGNSLVNARAEGLATKSAFRTSFRKRRCVVLADGFFEWQKVPGGKQPIYLHLKESRPFVFAGLWDRWHDLDTFSIITVPPNELVSPIHDRMPLILPESAIAGWLDPGAPLENVSSLMRSYPAAEMELYPVSKIVNTPKLDSPECIYRIDPSAAICVSEKSPPRNRVPRSNEPMLPGLGV
jgi:putative SOS response-associated peptidase YedK